jgi:hypothetical protein
MGMREYLVLVYSFIHLMSFFFSSSASSFNIRILPSMNVVVMSPEMLLLCSYTSLGKGMWWVVTPWITHSSTIYMCVCVHCVSMSICVVHIAYTNTLTHYTLHTHNSHAHTPPTSCIFSLASSSPVNNDKSMEKILRPRKSTLRANEIHPPKSERPPRTNSTAAPTDIFHMMCGCTRYAAWTCTTWRGVWCGVCCCGRNRCTWCRAQLHFTVDHMQERRALPFLATSTTCGPWYVWPWTLQATTTPAPQRRCVARREPHSTLDSISAGI